MGDLYQVGKAVYSEEKYVPQLAVIAFKYPNAIVTMHNAFYIHGLTDVIPQYDLATDRDATKIQSNIVNQYFVPTNFVGRGVETQIYKGYPIKIYNKERMLIELLRYKSKLPYDYYKGVLLNYRKLMPELDIQLIQDYALESPKSRKVIAMLQTEVF